METPTPPPEQEEEEEPVDFSFDRALLRLIRYLAIAAGLCAVVFTLLSSSGFNSAEFLVLLLVAFVISGISLSLLIGMPVVLYLWWKRGKKALVLTVLLFWIVAFHLTGGFCSGIYLKELYRLVVG